MITIIGILLLLVAGWSMFAMFANKDIAAKNVGIKAQNETVRERNQKEGYNRFSTVSLRSLFPAPPSKWYAWLAGSILVFMLNGLFFWADATKQYLLVYPTGRLDAVMTQGIKFRGYAKITDWPKYIDVKVVTVDAEGYYEIDVEDIEGVMKPIPIRFIDQVTADVEISTRFQLPADKDSFIALAIKFRSLSNLVNNTLIPTVREQVSNTGYMFKAQDYISGSAQEFRQTLDEQLKYGAYKIKKFTNRDTIYVDSTSRSIREIKTTYDVKKVISRATGKPIIVPHEITENNIIVSQVIIDDVDLNAGFKERLKKQRDESALRQLEQQKTSTAKDSQQRIIAEGERDKAAERVKQEKTQVGELIAIETKLKKEATNRDLAAIQLETEQINAKKRMIAADADAYEIRKKVSAGITPETKLQMVLDAGVARTEALSKMTWPVYYFPGGSGGKGDADPMQLMILKAIEAK